MPLRVVRSALCALACLLCALFCSCGSKGKPAQSAAPSTVDMVRSMSLLAGDVLSAQEQATWAQKLDAKQATSDALIDVLIKSPLLGSRVAPNLIFASFLNAKNYYAVPSMFTLKQSESPGREVIYYLRKPCSADEAVAVHPWWDLASSVQVCPDSYRPDKWMLATEEHSYRTRMPLSCDSQVGSPEKEDASLCGCGPNLIRCLQSEQVYGDLHTSMENELRDTTAYIVNQDEKLSSLFTTNFSMRDRNAEYLYQRRSIGENQGQDVDARIRKLRQWPEEPTWARREEQVVDEHAGVLTGLQLLTWLPDRRQRQRGYFEVMWCSGRDSFGATTEKIFEVSDSSNLAFTHDSWERLAHTELCTNCHARLDYGFQFFMGYPDARAGNHFMPSMAREGQGEMYGDNIKDPRGQTHLSPASFARLATVQPEFSTCMASHVSNYVLGPSAPLEDHKKVLASFQESGKFRGAMKTALQLFVKRFEEKRNAGNAPMTEPDSAEPVAATGGLVTLDPATRTLIEDNCLDCHDDESKAFVSVGDNYGQAVYLGQESYSRELMARAIEQVAFGNMPRKKTLEHPIRDALVTGMIDAMWPPGHERKAAQEYYVGQLRALEALQIDVALAAVRGDTPVEAGKELHWGAIERAIYADQSILSPGFLAMVALEASDSCEQAHPEPKAYESCLEQALQLNSIARWTH